jgi:Asp-tRNA(Asn)/Glu-tRNA(Gln) amidotransferase A subunit family amidase
MRLRRLRASFCSDHSARSFGLRVGEGAQRVSSNVPVEPGWGDPKTRVRIEAGAAIVGTDYVRMVGFRHVAIQSFGNNEVLVLPTTPIRAPLLSSVEEDATFHEFNGLVLRNPHVANMLACPSISLPLPFSAGLPVGLLLIGRRNADRRLLEIASSVEAIREPVETIPVGLSIPRHDSDDGLLRVIPAGVDSSANEAVSLKGSQNSSEISSET